MPQKIIARNKKQQPEFELQKQICSYLKNQYPNVLFLSDTVASLKLTKPQQLRNKAIQKTGFKTPDLLILEPNGKFSGLFIELKVKTIYKKNGFDLLKNEHVEEQALSIEILNNKGYFACFSWGFEMTKKIIDDYLSQKTHDTLQTLPTILQDPRENRMR